MVLSFVRAITLNTLRFLKIAHECCVALLPAVFVLENTRVHVGTPDSYNETTYIEALIDDFFYRQTIL